MFVRFHRCMRECVCAFERMLKCMHEYAFMFVLTHVCSLLNGQIRQDLNISSYSQQDKSLYATKETVISSTSTRESTGTRVNFTYLYIVHINSRLT